jgi:hypothetical protein
MPPEWQKPMSSDDSGIRSIAVGAVAITAIAAPGGSVRNQRRDDMEAGR